MILMVMLNQSIQEHPLLLLGLFYQQLTRTGVLTHESFGMTHFDWAGGKTKKRDDENDSDDDAMLA